MEDNSVKVVVGVIIGIIVLILGLSIIFIAKKIHKVVKDNTTTTTVQLDLSSISCYKVETGSISKREDMTITYNKGDLYKLDLIYTFTYKSAYDRDNTLSMLNTIISNEKELLKEYVSTSLETYEGGGKATVSYDITEPYTLMHTNEKYFHNNIYLKSDKLIEYLVKNNYICETKLG